MSPDLVFLHGWGMNAAVWTPLLEALSGDYRLHPLELPGHGHAPYRGQRDLAEWAEAVLASAPVSAYWLGWSLGGEVALQAALLAPERVQALLLTATAPRFVQGEGWPHAMPRGTLSQFAKALGSDYEGTIGRFLALQVRGSERGREVLRSLKQELAARPAADPAALAQGLELLRGVDLRADLTRLQCPHAWCFGERDSLIPIALADDLAVLAPQARIYCIPGAAHAPFLSHGAQWLGWVRENLS